jgi:hypothetical protein
LRRYVGGDHKDFLVWDLKHLTQIVGGDGRAGDLECEVVRRWFAVELSAMIRSERSMKLFEHTALASRVSGVLVDGARAIGVTSAVSTL